MLVEQRDFTLIGKTQRHVHISVIPTGKLRVNIAEDDAEEEADMDDMEDEMEESVESEEVVAEAAELKPVPAPTGGASEGSSPVASGGKASNDAHEPGAMSSGGASEGKKT